jgi:hypothetical protein
METRIEFRTFAEEFISKLTDEERADRANSLRSCLDAYMRTPAFELRTIVACDEIQKGGLTDAESLAHALGLPVEFLAIALEKEAAKYIARMGGIN